MNAIPQGVLYIVGTPIGNLSDITLRAIENLGSVDIILCENTQHSQKLLRHLNINKPLFSLHEHNERDKLDSLIAMLKEGKSMSLISDAGTPLISDPGFLLVRSAQSNGIQVSPVPGPCALIAALSSSGLPADHFCFQGFLPSREQARITALESLIFESRTLIFYEAPHRLLDSLKDMAKILGTNREACVARELTKTYESIQRGSLLALIQTLESDPSKLRGECVILVMGNTRILEGKGGEKSNVKSMEGEPMDPILLIRTLRSEMSASKAASIAAKITHQPKKFWYDLLLQFEDDND